MPPKDEKCKTHWVFSISPWERKECRQLQGGESADFPVFTPYVLDFSPEDGSVSDRVYAFKCAIRYLTWTWSIWSYNYCNLDYIVYICGCFSKKYGTLKAKNAQIHSFGKILRWFRWRSNTRDKLEQDRWRKWSRRLMMASSFSSGS